MLASISGLTPLSSVVSGEQDCTSETILKSGLELICIQILTDSQRKLSQLDSWPEEVLTSYLKKEFLSAGIFG